MKVFLINRFIPFFTSALRPVRKRIYPRFSASALELGMFPLRWPKGLPHEEEKPATKDDKPDDDIDYYI